MIEKKNDAPATIITRAATPMLPHLSLEAVLALPDFRLTTTVFVPKLLVLVGVGFVVIVSDPEPAEVVTDVLLG